MTQIIPPGSTIGILGGGQLGRMLATAAAQLGYRAHVYAPEASGPASEVAAAWTQGAYDDPKALAAFAASVDLATYEFENLDPTAVAALAERIPVRPGVKSLETARYRPAEKTLIGELGGLTALWRPVSSVAELEAALGEIGTPAILKTTLFGYDGKGQARIEDASQAAEAWATIGNPAPLQGQVPAIVEAKVDFFAEFSVILCRGLDGATAVWDCPKNNHRDGILDLSVVPASPRILSQTEAAVTMAKAAAEALDHVGVLTCEFFATNDGPVFNEMAPRVHNSGHWTIEGAVTSQFENHIRAICGLPLGATDRTAGRIEMRNLIGHDADDWLHLLSEPANRVHLYGKNEARPGRKMGHVTRLQQR